MKNQVSEKLDVKQKPKLERIYQDGRISNIQFLKKHKEFSKIRELNRQDANECLGEIITKASNLIGIKGNIENHFKVDIANLIHRDYNNLSLEEIHKAFEMDRHSPEPVEHFQLFNSTFVSKILAKFIAWKKTERKRLNLHLQQNEVLVLTEEEINKNREDLIQIIFNEIKNQDFSKRAWLIYDDVDAPNKERIAYKEVILERTQKKYYQKKKENRDFKGDFTQFIEQKQGDKTSIYNECKAILISDYLKNYVHDFEVFKSKINNN